MPERNYRAGQCHKIGMNMPVKNPFVQNPSQVQFKDQLLPGTLSTELEIETMGCALFDQQFVGGHRKGGLHKKPHGRTIGDRILRPSRRRSSSLDKSSSTAGDSDSGILADEDDDAFPYRVAARDTLESMMQDDSEEKREEILKSLAKAHEPLQEFTILFGAMKQIDRRTDISEEKKQSLKNGLNEMMTDLVNRERSGIRKGLCEGAESSPVAEKIDTVLKSRKLTTGLRDLRFKIGARVKGGVDEELTALVMAKALLKNVGAAYAEEAMESVCARLMPGLRTFSPVRAPAYQLTVSDSIIFSIARSGFKIAKDLKRDLVDKTGVLCKLHHVEAAVILFTAAEQGWGKGRGVYLVNQLVDLKNALPLTRANVYTAIRNATDMLPIATWPAERMSSRLELLRDLDQQVSSAHDEVPLLTTAAERKEEEWRNLYAAGRAPTPVVDEGLKAESNAAARASSSASAV